MLEFETIQFLFAFIAVLVLVALFIGLIYWKRWVRLKLGDKRLVDQLLKRYSPGLFKTKVILVLAAISLGILAEANLRKPSGSEGGDASGVDVMVLLDVSKSMLSRDAKPTRLDKAKQLVNSLLPRLENNRVGLILFAGQAYLQMPLTPDFAAAKMFVANATPDAVPVQGTVFGDALALANASLDVKQKKYKTVILISDGEDNDESAEETARQLAEQGVIVHTVGIGSAEGSYILEPGSDEPKKDIDGNVVVSKLNEALLQKIAFATKGSYLRLDQVNGAATALAAEIGSMEKKGIQAAGRVAYTSFFTWFIAVALLLLLAEIFIPERKTGIA